MNWGLSSDGGVDLSAELNRSATCVTGFVLSGLFNPFARFISSDRLAREKATSYRLAAVLSGVQDVQDPKHGAIIKHPQALRIPPLPPIKSNEQGCTFDGSPPLEWEAIKVLVCAVEPDVYRF